MIPEVESSRSLIAQLRHVETESKVRGHTLCNILFFRENSLKQTTNKQMDIICAPQIQSTCHYKVNHYVKIWHVRLGWGGGGVANNMHPLSWEGGGGQRERKVPKNFVEINSDNHSISVAKFTLNK